MAQGGGVDAGTPCWDPLDASSTVQEVQGFYRALVDALPDRLIVVFDADLRVRLLAGRGVDRAALPVRDMIGASLGELGVPEIRATVREQAVRALAGQHVVLPRVPSRGGRLWRLDLAPLPQGLRGRAAGLAVGLDVTDEEEARRDRDRMLWELQEAQRLAGTGSWSWDAATRRMWRSPYLRRLLELPDDHPETTVEDGLDGVDRRSPDRDRIRAAVARTLADHQPFELDVRLPRTDGRVCRLVLRAEVLLGPDGAVTGLRGTTQDVTAAFAARQALAESEERFRLAFDESPIGKALLSPPPGAGHLVRVNRALCALLEQEPTDLVGTSMWDWVHPDDRAAAAAVVPSGRADLDPGRAEVRLVGVPGHEVWAAVSATAVRDVDGRPLYLLAQIEDVTARRQAESQLVRQARFDGLTGLPNRVSLIEHLRDRLAPGTRVAVLFLDIDDFKTVNDSLGHAAGDALLERVAAQLSRCLRGDDYAARWGGDEFVVVSRGRTHPGAARALADQIRLAVAQPIRVDGHEVTATVSIGVAIGEQDSTSEGLLRDADIAMYRAKAAGKDRWAFADSTGHAGAMRRLTLGSALRHALDEGQLALHYQPVVDLVDGRLVSVEALLRWRHPDLGLLGPADFLDVAESSALIVPVGEWALRTAAFQAMDWYRRFGVRAPTVAVNVAARQLGHGHLHERVATALADSGLPASRLCLEVTEREAVAASGTAAADLAAVHRSGVLLAVDDFGTGYAGLDYLRRFPVDVLKIDQSFVRGLGNDPTDTAIIVSLISLGRALDVTVVAEGVENDTQRAMLRRLECPQGQGRLWSPPVSAERVDALIGPDGGAVPPRPTA